MGATVPMAVEIRAQTQPYIPNPKPDTLDPRTSAPNTGLIRALEDLLRLRLRVQGLGCRVYIRFGIKLIGLKL